MDVPGSMIWSDDAKGAGRQITVNVPDRQALLSDLRQRLHDGTGASVATLNLDHVVKLRKDPAFRMAYAAHSHITADGNPIVWLSRLSGQDCVRLVPGSELVDFVVALATELGAPVGLFGSTQATLDAAAERLGARHTGLNITFSRAPSKGFDPDGAEADAAIADIAASGVRVVLLALGAPKQERFAMRAHAAIPHTVFLSVGAGLDFVAGTQKRAPVWVRKLAAEWIWRLLGNPRRLAVRYGACLIVLPGLVVRALRQRAARSTRRRSG